MYLEASAGWASLFEDCPPGTEQSRDSQCLAGTFQVLLGDIDTGNGHHTSPAIEHIFAASTYQMCRRPWSSESTELLRTHRHDAAARQT